MKTISLNGLSFRSRPGAVAAVALGVRDDA
jgi:hypothetical protein